jgi:hypothetical protein
MYQCSSKGTRSANHGMVIVSNYELIEKSKSGVFC